MKRAAVTTFVIFFVLAPAAALAHPGHDGAGGLMYGFVHPVTGIDHVLAMIAVGVLAALYGGRALWLVPLSCRRNGDCRRHRHGWNCYPCRGSRNRSVCRRPRVGNCFSIKTANIRGDGGRWILCSVSRLCAWGRTARRNNGAIVCAGFSPRDRFTSWHRCRARIAHATAGIEPPSASSRRRSDGAGWHCSIGEFPLIKGR
jgi:HupE/UreJ protein